MTDFIKMVSKEVGETLSGKRGGVIRDAMITKQTGVIEKKNRSGWVRKPCSHMHEKIYIAMAFALASRDISLKAKRGVSLTGLLIYNYIKLYIS